MTEKQRNSLLASMTAEVADLVLEDNYGQNLALASAEAGAKPLMHVHESWIRRLERRGLLDREIEFLPSAKDFASRQAAGLGFDGAGDVCPARLHQDRVGCRAAHHGAAG
ncbi:MAG: NAD-glutamate dehydrogenase domain-containing protein [Nocardioidaceae bacterium]